MKVIHVIYRNGMEMPFVLESYEKTENEDGMKIVGKGPNDTDVTIWLPNDYTLVMQEREPTAEERAKITGIDLTTGKNAQVRS